MAWHALHHRLAVGATVELVARADGRPAARPGSDPSWPLLDDVVEGAGFTATSVSVVDGTEPRQIVVRAVRQRSLADTVGPRMRLLVCGLNPSLHAADAGVGFARPGNRFWPAALAAELVTRARDPVHALQVDHVGMTDLVKRASARASVLTSDEYAAGLARIERLAAWLRPQAVCIVGLAGWRAAADRRSSSGISDRTVGGRPVYVMPNTSGINASSSLDDLTLHLRAAAALADRSSPTG